MGDELAGPAADLFATTLQWTRQWLDESLALVWNPPGSGFGPPQSLHLVPNSARFAYGLLCTGAQADLATASSVIDALIELQYGLDAGPAAGTYRRFLETPPLPARPEMWVDYDPNWRQFVGTVFALCINDFEARLEPSLVGRMMRSITDAVEGEPDGRIPAGYTNPALLRSWLDAWTGIRLNRRDLVLRGEAFARAIVDDFDRWGAFDEFNSPTYYGVDLAALGLWRAVETTELFAGEGPRLESRLWKSIADFYNPSLRNFCGPYTRCYHVDSTRALSEVALWIWGAFGRDAAPLPDLSSPEIHHSHDLMWGPVVARLVRAPDSVSLSAFQVTAPRDLRQELANDRVVTAHIEPSFMVGAESSPNDWGGWDQFMPLVAHWSEGDEVCALTLEGPRVVKAGVRGRRVDFDLPVGPSAVAFRLYATHCSAAAAVLTTGATSVAFTASPSGRALDLTLTKEGTDSWKVAVSTPPQQAMSLHFTR